MCTHFSGARSHKVVNNVAKILKLRYSFKFYLSVLSIMSKLVLSYPLDFIKIGNTYINYGPQVKYLLKLFILLSSYISRVLKWLAFFFRFFCQPLLINSKFFFEAWSIGFFFQILKTCCIKLNTKIMRNLWP